MIVKTYIYDICINKKNLDSMDVFHPFQNFIMLMLLHFSYFFKQLVY